MDRLHADLCHARWTRGAQSGFCTISSRSGRTARQHRQLIVARQRQDSRGLVEAATLAGGMAALLASEYYASHGKWAFAVPAGGAAVLLLKRLYDASREEAQAGGALADTRGMVPGAGLDTDLFLKILIEDVTCEERVAHVVLRPRMDVARCRDLPALSRLVQQTGLIPVGAALNFEVEVGGAGQRERVWLDAGLKRNVGSIVGVADVLYVRFVASDL